MKTTLKNQTLTPLQKSKLNLEEDAIETSRNNQITVLGKASTSTQGASEFPNKPQCDWI